MMNTRKIAGYIHREIVVTVALACLAGLGWFDIAARTRASSFDWFIAESYADIIASSFQQGQWFTWFTYWFNGGSYVLQDPQAPLYSPLAPCVWLLGSRWGLRVNIALWGVAGFLGMTLWLRRYVTVRSAHVAALAWIWSLGFMWRIVVGNDMFMWMAATPWVLHAIDGLAHGPHARAAAVCALAGALLLWGPTYHAGFFCIGPLAALWWLGHLIARGRRPRSAGMFLAYSLLAAVLALAMSAPRVAAWCALPMRRPVAYDGTLTVWNTLRAVVDYSMCEPRLVTPRVGVLSPWAVWESSVALPFPATLLAFLGMVLTPVVRCSRLRRVWLFSCVSITLALILGCAPPVWRGMYHLLGGNVRVPERFLTSAAFGLAVLCALGADNIRRYWARGSRRVPWGMLLLTGFCMLWWRVQAQRCNVLEHRWVGDRPDAELAACINTIRLGVVLVPVLPRRLGTFETRPMLHGCVLATPGFQLTGVQDWTAPYAARAFQDVTRPGVTQLFSDVTGHVVLNLRPMSLQLSMSAFASVRLRLNPSPLGDVITCSPGNAVCHVAAAVGDYTIQNCSNSEIAICIRPRAPFRVWHVITAMIAGAACVVLLVSPRVTGIAPSVRPPAGCCEEPNR